MKTNYCTIFDKNYLFQGFALFLSLQRTAGDFMLYVLCMDDETLEVMGEVADARFLTPVSEHDLRGRFPELETHAQRTNRGQYCWSCQPYAVHFLLERFALPSVTYLEADSLFFSSPQPLLDEIGWRSVSIVPHRYGPGLDQTAASGRFCVQFNLFRNDEPARKVLDSWKAACLEYRRELRYLPGQKDLDTWPERFAPCIAVIQNLGAGVAPWNVQQYRIQDEGGVPFVNERPTIFYHFHQFAYLEGTGFDLAAGYRLPRSAIDAYYGAYVRLLGEVERLVRSRFPEFRYRNVKAKTPGWYGLARALGRRIKGTYNVFPAGRL